MTKEDSKLQEMGILRDYDNDELLFPIAVDIIEMVDKMVKAKRDYL